jgi:hypothetical protein
MQASPAGDGSSPDARLPHPWQAHVSKRTGKVSPTHGFVARLFVFFCPDLFEELALLMSINFADVLVQHGDQGDNMVSSRHQSALGTVILHVTILGVPVTATCIRATCICRHNNCMTLAFSGCCPIEPGAA